VSESLAIEVDHVVKHFGEVVAIDDVSLEVPSGTVLGLLGPNGAGKTTVVRVLTTLLRPDSGTASVLGLDVASDAQAVRTKIGLAGQYAAVDENLTGHENLYMVGRLTHLPKATARTRATELLAQFNLTDAGDRTSKTYSGGMRRRLDLAAALVHEPPVLFLDEPTTGLDPKARNDLWQVIADLVGGGTTVLLTTQYLEEADRLADRIAVIDQGRVIAQGTASELKTSMGQTILAVGFSDPAAAATGAAALGGIATGRIETKGTIVEVRVDDGTDATFEAVRALDAAGLIATSLLVREPSLDDVFLELTGHRAEPDEVGVEEPV
jgi:ABC-2 type transport system ATP-binding protein